MKEHWPAENMENSIEKVTYMEELIALVGKDAREHTKFAVDLAFNLCKEQQTLAI